VTVTGASIRHVQSFGFDHPEQSCWRDGATRVALRTVTHGDTDAIELALSDLAGAQLHVDLGIGTYVKVGDPLNPPANPHAPEAVLSVAGADLLAAGRGSRILPGTELEVSLERITAAALPREVTGRIELAGLGLEKGREHPLFLTARQRDQSRVWTSALFMTAG
jgi:hypothetical protein